MRLSIVMNNYNYARYLPEAIGNALQQMQADDEMIIVDDGSADDSIAVIYSYANDKRLRLIEQKNAGHLRAVRTGIDAASGDFIAILDSDDYYLPGYLERLREIYSEQPEVEFVFTKPQIFENYSTHARQTRKVIESMAFPAGLIGPSKWSTLEFYEFAGIPSSGLSMRTSLAKRMLKLPREMDHGLQASKFSERFFRVPEKGFDQLRLSADGLLVRCASALGAIKYYNDQPGWVYRIHSENKYATLSRFERWHARTHRKRFIIDEIRKTFVLQKKPTARALEQEILGRTWPTSKKRVLRFRLSYMLLALRSPGSFGARASAMLAAAGLKRGHRFTNASTT